LEPITTYAQNFIKMLKRYLPNQLRPLPFEEWVKRYPLGRQNDMRRARQEFLSTGLQRRSLKCFLKMESTSSYTDPRNICTIDDTIASIIGPYFSAVDHWLTTLPFTVKGLTPNARASKMQTLAKSRSYAIEIDISRMDKHVHYMYTAWFDVMLIDLLFDDETIRAEVVGNQNFRAKIFDFVATRIASQQSGRNDTACFQTLRNMFMVSTCCRASGVPHTFFVEGDDTVVYCAREDANVLALHLEDTPCFGFPTKVILRPNPDLAYFCGRYTLFSPLECLGDPLRALAKFHLKPVNLDPRAYLFAKSCSLLCLDSNSPILGAVARAVYHSTAFSRRDRKMRSQIVEAFRQFYSVRSYLHQGVNTLFEGAAALAAAPYKPTNEARALYDLLGIPVDVQLSFESQFRHDGGWALPSTISPLQMNGATIPAHVIIYGLDEKFGTPG